MFFILLYIIFSTLFKHVEGAQPFKPSYEDCHKKLSHLSQVKSTASIKSGSFKKKESLIDASKTYASLDQCNYTLVAPKMLINPYKLLIQNTVQQKPFNSFYLKCAACLAVAEEVSAY